MNNFDIFCLDNSELSEFEAINKGYRSDIYVKSNEEFFHLNIYNITRLKQDFEFENEEYGFYANEPNLVIVKEVSIKEIEKVLLKISTQDFFEKLKPLSEDEVKDLKLIKIN